jgi:uncharacterized protein (DUF58 family)
MITTEFLHQLERFSLLVNKRVTSNYIGDRFSKETGRGLIFKDHIKYEPGEDFRSVDWKVFGRTDKLFVKRYEEERNLTVHILLDSSGSMHFGSNPSKSDYAGMLATGFAFLALKNNERFVLGTFADKLEVFKAKKGKSQLATMVHYLNNRKPKGKSNLDESIAGYKKLIDSRSYIVIISDFLYPIDEVRRAISRFKHHTVVLVQVLDKMEKHLELEGDYKLKDLETNTVMRAYINPFARKQYESKLNNHIQKLKETCDELGAKFFSAHTGQDIFDVFYEIVGRTR